MEQIVTIERNRCSGILVLHPMGTFKGYGGYVGVCPYRELASTVTAEILGDMVLNLLNVSGPTGFHIKDIDSYRRQVADEDSERLRRTHLAGIRGTADVARRFIRVGVSRRKGGKTLTLVRFAYRSEERAFGQELRLRVKAKASGLALGEKILELMQPRDKCSGGPK